MARVGRSALLVIAMFGLLAIASAAGKLPAASDVRIHPVRLDVVVMRAISVACRGSVCRHFLSTPMLSTI